MTSRKVLSFPSSVVALGSRGDGQATEMWWTRDYPFSPALTGKTTKQLRISEVAATGTSLTATIGFRHAVLGEVLDVAKQSADPIDKTAILAASNAEKVAKSGGLLKMLALK